MDPRPIADPVSLLIAIKQEVPLIISLEIMSNFLALAIIIGVEQDKTYTENSVTKRQGGRQHLILLEMGKLMPAPFEHCMSALCFSEGAGMASHGL
jgi:hypothetical protein